MTVILKPLNQDSHILTVSSISSKVTESIITKVHIALPRSPGHMPNIGKKLQKSSSLEPIANGLDTLYVASSTQVQPRLFK